MQLTPVRRVLADLARVNGVRSAFFAARDGLSLAAAGEAVTLGGSELHAALVAAAFATVDRAISQLGVGSAEAVAVETATHTLHVAGVGDFILGVIADRHTNPALIRWEMRRAAQRIVAGL